MLNCKERVFSSHTLEVSRGGGGQLSRPARYNSWKSGNEEKLHKAYEAVKTDRMTLRQASEVFGVPKSTLHDRLTGKVLFGSHSGPSRLMSEREEEELVSFLIHCASVGYPRSRKETNLILTLVQTILTMKGYHGTVSYGWWDSFRKRHPDISLRKAEPLAHPRVICNTPEVINKYFDLLEETLVENDLLEKPCQIFNCDESGFPLDPTAPIVVVARGQKHPYSISSGDKTQITVLVCCSAGGYVIPPFIIYDRKNLKPEMTEGEVPGSKYGLSSSGWMDGELFDLWFRHHFLAYAPPARPLLLLLDGHSSHYTPSVIDKAAEEGVILFCLPPHSTHLTQPLDKTCFAMLKRCWQEECYNYTIENPFKAISRYNFSHIFHKAWLRGMTMQNISTSFRVTGVFPVNREAVLPPTSLPSPKLLHLKKNGVSFIPLYSPLPKRKSCSVTDFTPEEMALFEKRYNEGYDLTSESRYNLWLEMYHSSQPICTDTHIVSESTPVDVHDYTNNDTPSMVSVLPSSVLEKVISQQPVVKMPTKESKSSARILTSEENRKILKGKENRKREEEERKAEKRRTKARKIGMSKYIDIF